MSWIARGIAVPVPVHRPKTAVFLGTGAPVVRSAALLSVSVQPPEPPRRRSAVVLLGAGAGPDPSKQVAALPNPTKSTIAPPGTHAPDSNVAVRTSATFPAVALMLIVPVA